VQYSDRTLVCRECGSNFTFKSGEQAFFAARGLLNPPSRCPACRNVRKAGGSPVADGYVSYGLRQLWRAYAADAPGYLLHLRTDDGSPVPAKGRQAGLL
jgi:hypothetical protein